MCLLHLAGEQRAQVKGIKERSLVNKAKNEAKRELEEAQVGAGSGLVTAGRIAASWQRQQF